MKVLMPQLDKATYWIYCWHWSCPLRVATPDYQLEVQLDQQPWCYERSKKTKLYKDLEKPISPAINHLNGFNIIP